MLNLFRKKTVDLFSKEEKDLVVAAIQAAECRTSGEVRVYIESKCRFVKPVDRAIEIFRKLNMQNTAQRNAVVVYVAMKDRQLAVYGDQGIHEKVGSEFWNEVVKKMLQQFNSNNYASGIATVVTEIGKALQEHFPYDALTDINELPDDIVFGK
jgi:uncharacterized membrane protein